MKLLGCDNVFDFRWNQCDGELLASGTHTRVGGRHFPAMMQITSGDVQCIQRS
jgi:hypothetical protein